MRKSTKIGLAGVALAVLAIAVGLSENLTAIIAESIMAISALTMLGAAGMLRENNK